MSEHIYIDSDMENERYHVIPFGSMREEIVRCRDCKHFDPYTGSCARRDFVAPMAVEANDFCSRGESE